MTMTENLPISCGSPLRDELQRAGALDYQYGVAQLAPCWIQRKPDLRSIQPNQGLLGRTLQNHQPTKGEAL